MDNDKLRDKLSILGEEVMYVGDSGVITHIQQKRIYKLYETSRSQEVYKVREYDVLKKLDTILVGVTGDETSDVIDSRCKILVSFANERITTEISGKLLVLKSILGGRLRLTDIKGRPLINGPFSSCKIYKIDDGYLVDAIGTNGTELLYILDINNNVSLFKTCTDVYDIYPGENEVAVLSTDETIRVYKYSGNIALVIKGMTANNIGYTDVNATKGKRGLGEFIIKKYNSVIYSFKMAQLLCT